MTTLIPFNQACPHNDAIMTSERYAENLRQALTNEISTPSGAHDFLCTTYPTATMTEAARLIFHRLTHGKESGAPGIYRFNSQYGGGKTHTLIALAAMSKHPSAVEGTGFSEIAVPNSVTVFDFSGEDSNPNSGQELSGTNLVAHSLTGALAYHLGGEAALARYSKDDRELTSPGADAYRAMLGSDPVLILIDELPVYVRKAVAAGNRDIRNTATIIYDLIAAVDSSPKAALIITAPDRNSDAFQEETGEVHRIIDEAQSIISRRAHDMTPTAPADLPPILRRRLFTGCDENARRSTADAYREIYARHYPNQARNLAEQIYDSYPFHPALLNLINNRLAANNNFQKVRGTLRLLSNMVKANVNRHTALLHPQHLDPDAEYFTSELNSRLEQGAFTAAIQTDISGDDATVSRAETPMPKNVAVTVLLGSLAPMTERGLTQDEVVRAIMSPENHDPGIIRDAIYWLESRAIYIAIGERDLKFSVEPNIRNEVNAKTAEFQRDGDRLRQAVHDRLQAHFMPARNSGPLGTRIFPSEKDIPDTPSQVQLAVVNPSYCNQQSQNLHQDLAKLYFSTDNNAKDARRANLNNVLLLVAKSNNWPGLEQSIARQMAARFVKDRLGRTITQAQEDELSKTIESEDTHITQEICTHWSELYYPAVSSQQIGGAPLGHVSITTGTTDRDGQQTVIDALQSVGKISPNDTLDNQMVWGRMNQLNDPSSPPTVRDMMEIFASSPGQTMMLDKAALQRAIANAVKDGYLVVHTANGQAVQEPDGRLFRDEYVIYRADSEPTAELPGLPALPELGQEGSTNAAGYTGAATSDGGTPARIGEERTPVPAKPKEFSDSGNFANNAVQMLDQFMAQNGYAPADIAEVRITGMGEPLLTYLAGLFDGENAVCQYTSVGNECELSVNVPIADYAAKKMLWQNFKALTGDDGTSNITVSPSHDRAVELHRKLRRMTNQTIDLRVRFN